MTKKEEKRRERRKKALKFVLIPYVFSLVMIGLGIWGLVRTNVALRAYQNSDDVRNVEAKVTYVEVREEKDAVENTKKSVWDAKLAFTVEGKEYTGETRLYRAVKEGDPVTVEVYRTAKGTYEIPTVTSETGKGLSDILMYVALGVGILVFCGATVYLIDELKKTKPRGKGGNAPRGPGRPKGEAGDETQTG